MERVLGTADAHFNFDWKVESMIWPDVVNGSFELLAGFACWLHVRALWHSKRVQGVSIISFAFFTVWGYWNMFYYPHLEQWFSFFGGFAIVVMNTVWVVLAITYTRRRRNQFKHLKAIEW